MKRWRGCIGLSLLLFVCFFCMQQGCSDRECVNGIKLVSYNPSGLSCTSVCDCSNLRYEGVCVEGVCRANRRTAAQRKGEVRFCKLLQKFQECEEGTQEAQPEPLTELLWGDCLPPKPVVEDTLALCSDGKDNDCDGLVDDKDPDCEPFCPRGQSEPCYEGQQGTLNVGNCRAGIRNCQEDRIWGVCLDQVLPQTEVCNGQDDDCDGLTDNRVVCPEGEVCRQGSCQPIPTEESLADGGTEGHVESKPVPEYDSLYQQGILVRADSFERGSPLTEVGREEEEKLHRVTLTNSFYMGRYEVTEKEFEEVMGYKKSRRGEKSCPDCALDQATWHEAAAFSNALSEKFGLSKCFACEGSGNEVRCDISSAHKGEEYYRCLGYRLPTDAEWEYAYRAGTKTAFYNQHEFVSNDSLSTCSFFQEIHDIAWYCFHNGNDPDPLPREVGQKVPNAWGLYDMAGNVAEWVVDVYGNYPNESVRNPIVEEDGFPRYDRRRVLRNANRTALPRYMRASYRRAMSPYLTAGFRVVRSN